MLPSSRDARSPRAVFDEAWRSLNFIGHAGVSVMALAALDTACWDLAAQAAGARAHAAPIGQRDRVCVADHHVRDDVGSAALEDDVAPIR